MLNIARGQRVKVFKIEDKGNYSLVRFSTSRKDKRDDEYKYSNWSFVRFVGRAHDRLSHVEEGDRIILDGAGISLEPYMKNGEKLYPKNPQIIVFNFNLLDEANIEDGGYSEPDVENDESDEDFPF